MEACSINNGHRFRNIEVEDDMRGLDNWITGHDGEDHPDNQVDPWNEQEERFTFESAQMSRAERRIDEHIANGTRVGSWEASWRPGYRRGEWPV